MGMTKERMTYQGAATGTRTMTNSDVARIYLPADFESHPSHVTLHAQTRPSYARA